MQFKIYHFIESGSYLEVVLVIVVLVSLLSLTGKTILNQFVSFKLEKVRHFYVTTNNNNNNNN